MQITRARIGIIVAALGLITFGAFLLADSLTESSPLAQFLRNAGFVGTILVGIIGGLNPIVPIPPATFAPLFLESGVSVYAVIAGFVIGTTIADMIGYALGRFGKRYADTSFPEFTARMHEFLTSHTRLVLPATFAYFAFAPLPNEFILIPLGLSGYAYRTLIIPIILGNIVHHTILVIGYVQVFNYFF